MKRYDRTVLLRTSLASFHTGSKVWIKREAWSLSAPDFLSCMCNLLTSYSLSVSLNSPILWPPGILCSWGIVNNSKWWTHLLCTYPLLMTLLRWPIGLHLKYIKIKLLRISRWQQQSLKPRVAPYQVWIPCPSTGDTSLKSSCWGRYGEGRRNSI